MRILLIVCVMMAAGCAVRNSENDAMSFRRLTENYAPTVIGTSVQGRPIEMYEIGSGARPVLVLAAIHGDESTTVPVARNLLDVLRQSKRPATAPPVMIIPTANPDGFAAGTRTNAHHIDLNRNFPANNWSARSNARSRNNFGGAASASEPESAALIKTIERLHPRLIISMHSMDKPCNNYDGPAQAIAELMSRYNHYPTLANIGYPTPGSMGSWAGIDKQIPMITLELPRHASAEEAWKTNKDALVAAIDAVAQQH